MTRCLVSTVAVCALIVIATAPGAAAPTPPTDGSPPDEARPEPEPPEPIEVVSPVDAMLALSPSGMTSESLVLNGDARGVAEDFLVLPDGAELGGRLRVITADDAVTPRSRSGSTGSGAAGWGSGTRCPRFIAATIRSAARTSIRSRASISTSATRSS